MEKHHLALSVVGVVLAGACAEPVHDQQVKALGDDPRGVPDGEFHRAGQPCLTCHGFFGPASSRFAVGGTVFAGPQRRVGANQVLVELIDSTGSTRSAPTDCVGNFFVRAEDWDPAFPILVALRGDHFQPMSTQIAREGSCSQCHSDPPTFDSPGHVRLNDTEPTTPTPTDCPYSPDIGGQ
jgi:hypothetical protein